jgi:uridine kinase
MMMCDLRAGWSVLQLHAHDEPSPVCLLICLRRQASTKLFFGCRIQRDVAVRGRDVAGVIEQYTQFVKPMFDQYVAPSRKHADVIIPWARYGSNLFPM